MLEKGEKLDSLEWLCDLYHHRSPACRTLMHLGPPKSIQTNSLFSRNVGRSQGLPGIRAQSASLIACRAEGAETLAPKDWVCKTGGTVPQRLPGGFLLLSAHIYMSFEIHAPVRMCVYRNTHK